jgi:light-regulated signal transduction histidine kinase (bacteriophytochrome)
VSLYTQLLASRYARFIDKDGQRFMGYITDNAMRMQNLISDLLEFSRLEADGSDRFSVCSCDAAVEEALSNLRARIDESKSEIVRQPLPQVYCDRIQLARLFQNLIINAIKYRRPDVTPKVRISAEPSGNAWMFRIEDNGVGIEPQFTEKIFGIFKRLHGRDNPGTGMGLAICRKIVVRHGGRIWVESTPGQGSTFLFSLPKKV